MTETTPSLFFLSRKACDITTRQAHGYVVGDRIEIEGFSNRYRHYISAIPSLTSFEAGVWIRGSKGWRRHVRNQKARARLAA